MDLQMEVGSGIGEQQAPIMPIIIFNTLNKSVYQNALLKRKSNSCQFFMVSLVSKRSQAK